MIMSVSSGGQQYIFELGGQLNISKKTNAEKNALNLLLLDIIYFSFLVLSDLKK
jgi:hypothetical protein